MWRSPSLVTPSVHHCRLAAAAPVARTFEAAQEAMHELLLHDRQQPSCPRPSHFHLRSPLASPVRAGLRSRRLSPLDWATAVDSSARESTTSSVLMTAANHYREQ
jgi:hypothetical protein